MKNFINIYGMTLIVAFIVIVCCLFTLESSPLWTLLMALFTASVIGLNLLSGASADSTVD
ncbi:hypothetical protein EBB07_18000 [Paenibacillaceae bacterium]|nr:hypothetical protein EBB07_18000 [Paenibacillaceae bacterium]